MSAGTEPMEMNAGKDFSGKTTTSGRTAQNFAQPAGSSSHRGESWNAVADKDSASLMEERYAILDEGIF